MESSQLPSMDSSKGTDEISFNMMNNTNEGLVRLGKNNKVEDGMATKMTQSKDGKTWTFTLRKGAKWSNGDEVTANDFVYGWRRTVNPKTGDQYSYIYSGIKNADKIINGKKAVNTLGIKADGKYKLTVSLEKNIPYFKYLLGFVPFFPQNQQFVEKQGKAYGTKSSAVLSNGPYTLKKIHDQVVADSNTALNQFQSGKLDAATLTGQQVKNMLSKKNMVVRPMGRLAYLEFNRKDKKVGKAFSNVKIRQAISYALQRKQLVKNVIADGSLVAPGFVTKDLAKNPKTGADFTEDADADGVGISYDKAKAQKLMKEGLKEVGLKKLEFTLSADNTPQEKNTAEYIQSQLQKVFPQVKVENLSLPYKTRLQRSASKNFQAVITLWGADYADPSNDLNIMTSDNPQNNGSWKNAKFDKYMDAANNAGANEESERWSNMVKAEQELMKDQGVVPLFQTSKPQMMNPKVKGVIYNTAGTPFNFKEMYVVK
ncbi:oligopeptide transport system substrate-binding protein [Secundilactobacillus oryzae JCM 18671]|uniref:Oligopeptide transport system substrate-binding protein n=1 Tax=Secundilactobacillus oryzae JCM 18671 TaxID=1291743 RepID=A0A081BI07_9LACO|nr:oligopeptide transport system substrate-binding protein [Secundilactobacillus oryzae JCM 18671]